MGRWAGKTETPIFTPWIEEAHHKEKAHNQRWEKGGPSTNKWVWGSEPVNNKPQSLIVGTAWRTLLDVCMHGIARWGGRKLEFANTLETISEMRGQVNPNLRFTKMIKQVEAERYWLHKYSELSKFRLNKLTVFNQNPNKQCNVIVFNEGCL